MTTRLPASLQMVGFDADDTLWNSEIYFQGAHAEFEKILGGHFLRESTIVDFSPAMPQLLIMENYYGWDGENKKLVAYEVSNQGRITPYDLGWDDGKLVLTASVLEKSVPHLGRTVMDVVDDGLVFEARHAPNAAGNCR